MSSNSRTAFVKISHRLRRNSRIIIIQTYRKYLTTYKIRDTGNRKEKLEKKNIFPIHIHTRATYKKWIKPAHFYKVAIMRKRQRARPFSTSRMYLFNIFLSRIRAMVVKKWRSQRKFDFEAKMWPSQKSGLPSEIAIVTRFSDWRQTYKNGSNNTNLVLFRVRDRVLNLKNVIVQFWELFGCVLWFFRCDCSVIVKRGVGGGQLEAWTTVVTS